MYSIIQISFWISRKFITIHIRIYILNGADMDIHVCQILNTDSGLERFICIRSHPYVNGRFSHGQTEIREL